MDIRELILKRLHEKGEVRSADIVRLTSFSREYVGRFLRQLQLEGKLVLVGKANQAKYVPASSKRIKQAKRGIMKKRLVLDNNKLSEDVVLEKLKRDTGIWLDLPANVSAILDYAFTEILNNAIDHSKSRKVLIDIKRDSSWLIFNVIDRGVGIFNNIRDQRNLKNSDEAIEDLIKGKQTTMPKAHSGEGIFFTSKVADMLVIQGEKRILEFNNIIDDIFVRNISTRRKGTRVTFQVSLKTRKSLNKVFGKFSDDTFSFSKTKVTVKLFASDIGYISRSQARRLLSGLDKFNEIILDFKNVKSVGQAFADEVFRVFKKQRPKIIIRPINMDKAVSFMIKRAQK